MAGYYVNGTISGENIKNRNFHCLNFTRSIDSVTRTKVAKRWTGNISMVNQRERREIVSKMIKQVVCVCIMWAAEWWCNPFPVNTMTSLLIWKKKVLEKNGGYDSYKKLSKKANISHQNMFYYFVWARAHLRRHNSFLLKKFMTAFSLL